MESARNNPAPALQQIMAGTYWNIFRILLYSAQQSKLAGDDPGFTNHSSGHCPDA